MKGRVKGILPDDTEIQTESVFYDHERHIITTKDKILIKRGKSSMEGLGMVIDLKKEKLSILGKVKALGNR
jgi:LPS export ABC transporter protein LptC